MTQTKNISTGRTSRLVAEDQLPSEVSVPASISAAYPDELARASEALLRSLPVLIECDKGMVSYFYAALRTRLKTRKVRCVYIDGRVAPAPGQMPMGLVATMVGQLRDAVRGGVETDERLVMVLPHLDLLTTSSGALTTEAREVVALLYENPNILWLGFRDPSFTLPKVISNLFQHRITVLGVPRDRLEHLVTQKESRKLGRSGLDVYQLYKHVSGISAARLRQLLTSLEGEDYPEDASPVWRQIRQATLEADLSVPDMSLEDDIGGYADVKRKITEDILDIIRRKEALDDPREIAKIESLIPRGMIFWGPPGTGKTLFAKAIASRLGAAIQVVNGPELKSRWVGESEENLRRIFAQARQSAPSIIVFDELDSFAAARGTYTGSGVEHSMVNQLLTEMDGFRSNEMVFVVGTTNFVESIDPALLRPGRFEFHLHVPYPKADDREAILNIYNERLGLKLSSSGMNHAVRQTGLPTDGNDGRAVGWSGDHIQALCRSLARQRLRTGRSDETDIADIELALTANQDLPKLTPEEELAVATHECGHAIVALHTDHSPTIDRISIRGDVTGALGFVRYADPAHRYVITHAQLCDSIATLFGGREAEKAVLGHLTIGSAQDIERATQIARALVQTYSVETSDLEVRVFEADEPLSHLMREKIEWQIRKVLEREQKRAISIIHEHRDELLALRGLLLEKKVLDAGAWRPIVGNRKPEGATS